MTTLLRFFILLSLVIWVGGIIFFSLTVAPHVFAVLLPITGGQHLAGEIVARSIHALHIMGIICGVVFLICVNLPGGRTPKAARWFVLAMIILTVTSQFEVSTRLEQMRLSGQLSAAAQAQFDRLHTLSVSFEGITLLCGLVALWFVAREPRE